MTRPWRRPRGAHEGDASSSTRLSAVAVELLLPMKVSRPMRDLFDRYARETEKVVLGADAVVLSGFAYDVVVELLTDLRAVTALAPFRNMVTPGGYTMSVAMTNCGIAGWVTDLRGYRYTRDDPVSGLPWPPMPATFLSLATRAAQAAGFEDFVPDACLINRYAPGAKLSLHQDKNEAD